MLFLIFQHLLTERTSFLYIRSTVISGSRLPSALFLDGYTDAITGLAISPILPFIGCTLFDFTSACFFAGLFFCSWICSKARSLGWPFDESGCEVEARDKSGEVRRDGAFGCPKRLKSVSDVLELNPIYGRCSRICSDGPDTSVVLAVQEEWGCTECFT